MPQLVAVKGPMVGNTFELGDTVVIGRSLDCQLRLDDLTVSRVHARITRTPEGMVIEDMNSGNGTYVNQNPIQEPTLLNNNDLIRVSQHVFTVVDQEEKKPDMGSSTLVAIEDRPATGESSIVGTLDVKEAALGAVSEQAKAEGADAILKAHERLRTIVEISNTVQTEFDIRRLLDRILQSLFDVFPHADRGFVMLKDDDGKLKPRAAWTRSGHTEEITVSRRIVNEVTEKRIAILSADAMGDERFDQAMSIVNFRIRSMMCAPLLAQDDLLGIMHIDTARQDERFTAEDLELLTGVANQTALAIANAKMHERLVLRERMERDLQLATQVQQSFLPDKTPQVEGMEFAACYRAAHEVGGDFYDFIRQGDDRIVTVMGDVSGKGVPAALLMAKMTSDVRYFALQESEPKNIVGRLNDHMNESSMEDVFVTLLLAKIDLGTHAVTLSNAAHCPAMLRRAAENDVIQIATEGNFPLGVVPGNAFEQETYTMQPGDVICLFTDGVTEAMNADQDLYGFERLRAAIAASACSAQGVMDAIMKDVHAFVGDTKQSDDLTCVCCGVVSSSAPTLPQAAPAVPQPPAEPPQAPGV